MRVITGRAEWREALDEVRARDQQVGFVPTMGALHDGHASLVAQSVAAGDVCVVSIFVNPLQFGQRGDLTSYPRDLEADVDVLEQQGCSLLFAPEVDEVYPSFPEMPSTLVTTRGAALPYEGAHRPGHFDGVATVLTKLFSLTGPCRAYFGEKDFQQVAVVRQIVDDLWLPVEVVACPTVRADDGLALSSRNTRLSPRGRAAAPVIARALGIGAERIAAGAPPSEAHQAMVAEVEAEPMATLEYVAIVDPASFEEVERFAPGIEVRLLMVVEIEGVRLIDNRSARPDGGLR